MLHFQANFLFPYVSTLSGTTGRYQVHLKKRLVYGDNFVK